ncbi:hypothetical protein TNCV_2185751 [Trichonephila clavipes]|nr:hypothetical protein TNCV_2185751 [Trichonephila clavipes]
MVRKTTLFNTTKINQILTVAVGRLMARAPDSGLEGLSSMNVPPNTLGVHTQNTCSLNQRFGSLVGLIRSAGNWRKFISTLVPCLNCGGGDRWWRHLS